MRGALQKGGGGVERDCQNKPTIEIFQGRRGQVYSICSHLGLAAFSTNRTTCALITVGCSLVDIHLHTIHRNVTLWSWLKLCSTPRTLWPEVIVHLVATGNNERVGSTYIAIFCNSAVNRWHSFSSAPIHAPLPPCTIRITISTDSSGLIPLTRGALAMHIAYKCY